MLSLTLSAAPAMSGSWSAGSVVFCVARSPPSSICTTSWVASKSVRRRDSGAFSRLSSIESPSHARRATRDAMPRARPRDRTDQAALTPGLPWLLIGAYPANQFYSTRITATSPAGTPLIVTPHFLNVWRPQFLRTTFRQGFSLQRKGSYSAICQSSPGVFCLSTRHLRKPETHRSRTLAGLTTGQVSRDMQISCAMQFTLRQAELPIDPHDPRDPRVELQRDVAQRINHDVPERRAAAPTPSLAHTRAGPTTTTDCAGVELNARTGITPLTTVQDTSGTARHASGGCSLMSQASVGTTGKIAGP